MRNKQYTHSASSGNIVIPKNSINSTSIYESILDIWHDDQRKEMKFSSESKLRNPRLLYKSSRILKNYNENEAKLVWNIYNLDQKANEDMMFIECIGIYLEKNRKIKYALILITTDLIIYNEADNKIYARIELNRVTELKKINEKQMNISFLRCKDKIDVLNFTLSYIILTSIYE